MDNKKGVAHGEAQKEGRRGKGREDFNVLGVFVK